MPYGLTIIPKENGGEMVELNDLPRLSEFSEDLFYRQTSETPAIKSIRRNSLKEFFNWRVAKHEVSLLCTILKLNS